MQKKWLLPVIGFGAVLATIAGGSVVLAQTATPTETPSATATPTQTPAQKFADRLAEILGLDKGKVEAAVKQVQRETVDNRVKARLDQLVANGKLTQAQADELFTWFQSRPQDIPGFLDGGMGKFGGMHGHRGHHGHMMPPMMQGQGGSMQAPSTLPSGLQVEIQ